MSVNKVNSDGTVKRIAGGTLYADAPLGTILAYGGATAPAGWMLCQGQALSRTTYAKLYEIIGTAFGSGDGSTTFNLPDLRGEFLRGAGTNSHTNQGNGGSVGQHQDATHISRTETAGTQMALYKYASDWGAAKNWDKQDLGTSFLWVEGTTQSMSEQATAGTVRPTNTSVNYIIKVMMVSLPADLEAQVEKAVAAKLTNKWTTYDAIQNSTTSSEVSGTVSKDGMLNISIATGNSHSDGRVLCYINDIEVFNINNITGTTISIGARQTFRVNKGDTYKFTPQNGGIIYQVFLYHN